MFKRSQNFIERCKFIKFDRIHKHKAVDDNSCAKETPAQRLWRQSTRPLLPFLVESLRNHIWSISCDRVKGAEFWRWRWNGRCLFQHWDASSRKSKISFARDPWRWWYLNNTLKTAGSLHKNTNPTRRRRVGNIRMFAQMNAVGTLRIGQQQLC